MCSVLLHIRSATTARLLLHLSVSHLVLLQGILETGLQQFKGAATKELLPQARSLMVELDLVTTDENKQRAGGRSHAELLRPLLLKQDPGQCLVRHADGGLHASHIISFATGAAVSRTGCPIWFMLAFLFGPEFADYMWTVASNSRDCTSNRICLESRYRGRHGDGDYVLDPLPGQTQDHLDLRFTILNETTRWQLTIVPRSREDPSAKTPELRMVADGDVYRVTTKDPVRFLLPSIVLLQARNVVYRLSAMTGFLASTDERKKMRKKGDVKEARRPPSRGGG